MKWVYPATLSLILAGFSGAAAVAQDGQVSGDQDGSSQAVEESDEAYRRRMELEDARNRDPTYTDPPDDYRRDLEKIDKLPRESRENIRDQLIDIIVENPEWEPEDALEEYPYEPTAAAMADAELMQQEQEAWDEQIEKYHAREAAAYGAYRGPVAGPGNPGGQQGSSGAEASEGSEGGGQDDSGQGQGQGQGQQGSQGANSSAGTYQPYESQNEQSEDAVSNSGVSESALDFLLRQQSGEQPGTQASEAPQQGEAGQVEQAQSSQAQSDSESTADPDMRGILAIEDLDKMEGAGGAVAAPPQNEDEDEETDESGEGDATGGG